MTKSLSDIFNIEEGHDASAIMKYLMQILHDEVVTYEDQEAAEMEGGNKESKTQEANEEEELLKKLEAEMNKLND